MACEPHVAPCLFSCSSYIHVEVCVFYICLILLSSIRYFRVRRREGAVILVCPSASHGSLQQHLINFQGLEINYGVALSTSCSKFSEF